MRSRAEFRRAAELSAGGLSDGQVAAATGVPRSTVRDWRRGGFASSSTRRSGCPSCEEATLRSHRYAYLLGLYLGDGHVAAHPRGVFRLRVFLDDRYPAIVEECRDAVETFSTERTLRSGVVSSRGCVYVSSYWKHWPCVFPQHGPGPKHLRAIRLEVWQDEIVRAFPQQFLRGLVHSDGCRVHNRVGGRRYVRYMFCNHSADIAALFERACADAGIRCTRPSWRTVSVARAEDTSRMDVFVGPKR